MPITEAPQNSSSTPPEQPRTNRRGKRDYSELEGYDLLHVIDQLEDERLRVSLREKIWLALILHMLFFAYILFAPKYIYHVQVRDPSKNKKDMTYLELPPDALKQLRPKTQAPMSDKDRVQQSPKPTLDKKTLQELEAMRRAGPPVMKPAPPAPKAAPAPQLPPPQVAQQQPIERPAQPLPQNQASAPVEAPKPAPTRTQPNFSTSTSPSDALQQAAKQASKGAQYGDSGGDMGANAPSDHGGMNGGVDVLSDTLGVDFGPYLKRVIYDTKRSWYPIIPQAAMPPLSKQGRVLIRFKIYQDGSVKDMKLEGPSGDVSLDRAAWGGILGASPFPTLPKNFKGPYLELRFYFLYNERPGVQ